MFTTEHITAITRIRDACNRLLDNPSCARPLESITGIRPAGDLWVAIDMPEAYRGEASVEIRFDLVNDDVNFTI